MANPDWTDPSDFDDPLDKQLAEIGCPYTADDYRARIWLDGYQAAVKQEADKLRREIEALQ